MTKQTDKKAKELGKGREEKPEEVEEEEQEEEEQSSDGDEAEDEEQGDESDQDESEEEEDNVASAKPAVSKSRRAASEEDDEAEEEEEDEGEEEEDEEDEQDEQDEEQDTAEAPADGEDPYWWTPHAVLGALVLIGVLGFFGVFNKAFGFLAGKRAPAAPETPAAAAAPPAKPSARPFQPPSQQQPQAPVQMFGAKHLLVMHKGSKRVPPNITRTKEEAKARAEEALKKLKSGKVKFEEAVSEYSDEPGAAQRGGDLREFPKGAMVPEFQTGLEKTKVGEISDLVETPFGYHIILRTK